VSTARFQPSGRLRGSITPPADKSISHRAAILAAMADGESEIENYLDAADTRSTLAAMRVLGAGVARDGGTTRIQGVGLRGAASGAVDVGNAGTLMRLLPGWLAGQPKGEWMLDGDESIRRRLVDRVVKPLAEMGARVSADGDRLPPLTVRGAELHGITYRLPVASAQVKSCVLLAGLLAGGETTVIEPAPTRDHTERMLRAAGADVLVEPAGTPVALRGQLPGNRVTVRRAERLAPGAVVVPGDFSSAAFLLVAAALTRGSEVRVEGVGLNPTRIGLLGILNRMGAGLEVSERPAVAGEPTGSVTARHGPPLEGVRVGAGEVPLAIDELPLVGLLGCFAEGTTHLTGAGELRHKESDRIAAVVDGLARLGADIEATTDGFVVTGTGGLRGGALDSHGDHRLAMLGAVAGLASREGVEVRGFEAAGISYPRFEADLRGLLGS
jgi:3-phosphoshikimate 1-carboxyvinyltransferase